MTRAATSTNSKAYYKGGVKVSIGGVPCRMARKPGEYYSKAVREGQHGFDKASLKSVRAAEGRYARECLETMGAKLPKAPKVTGGLVRGVWSWTAQKAEEKALAVWDAECVAAYLKALEKAGRPQVVTEVVDESEPLLDLAPVEIEQAPEAPIAPAMRVSFMKDGKPFTPTAAQIQEAREAATLPERKLIASLLSGETVANDPVAWIEELEASVDSIRAGRCDGNFTVWQRMDFHLTGSCRPFLT